MELLRLPPVEPDPPPPAPLARCSPDLKSIHPAPSKASIAALEPMEHAKPLVIKLPPERPVGVEEGLSALSALAASSKENEEVPPPPQRDTMFPLQVELSPVEPPGADAATAIGPDFFRQPKLPLGSLRQHEAEFERTAGSLELLPPKPVSAGARIVKAQPLPVESEVAVLPPQRREAPKFPAAALHCDRMYALEPFRRELANPVFPTGQHEQFTKSGQHVVTPTRWEFLHELPEDSRRSRPQERRAPKPQLAAPNRESVAPWLMPARPLRPEFRGDLHRFDWAQLIARLADFEDTAANANKTNKHGATTTRLAAVARERQERLRAIPVIGPILHFWQTQSWASRGLALAIPILGFIAIKPSLDGSLREPVVLAKEMPRPVSTVVRREPSREILALRGGATATNQIPPIPDGLPKPTAPTLQSETPAAPGQAHPKLVPERNAAPNKAAGNLPVATVEPKLNKFDQMLLSRAAVELADDFSFGLDSWEARSNAVQWTYDATGFVRPRGLAIYRPSLNLADYSVEFLAKIDYSAISWVVRAQDLNNYMVVKMVQRGGGPLPRYTVMHYPVVNGREGARIEHPLPLNLYKDTLFHIRMDIRGSNYAVLVQDSVVDSWSDDRFPVGGVGFFTGAGEEARIRWVQVTYQNDFVGKLCAWLAPKAK